MDNIEKRLEHVEKNTRQNSEDIIKMTENIKNLEYRNVDFKVYTETINELNYSIKSLNKAVIDLASVVTKIESKLEDTNKKVEVQDKRIDDLENKTGKLATKAWVYVICGFAGVFIANMANIVIQKLGVLK